MQFLLHHNVITQAITSNDHKTLKQCRDKNSAGWVLSNSLATLHSDYDYEAIVKQSRLVVDTRNACAKIKSDKIIKA